MTTVGGPLVKAIGQLVQQLHFGATRAAFVRAFTQVDEHCGTAFWPCFIVRQFFGLCATVVIAAAIQVECDVWQHRCVELCSRVVRCVNEFHGKLWCCTGALNVHCSTTALKRLRTSRARTQYQGYRITCVYLFTVQGTGSRAYTSLSANAVMSATTGQVRSAHLLQESERLVHDTT